MFKFEVHSILNGKSEDKYNPKFETYADAINYISRVVKAIKDEVTANLFDPYLTEFKNSNKLIPDADMNALTFEYTVDGKSFINRWEIKEI